MVNLIRRQTPSADKDRSPLEPLVLIVGLGGLLQDSWAPPVQASWMNLHALFGGLLWFCVVARFYHCMHRVPRMPPEDMRAFSRHLSRRVYLLLYILMFFSLSIGVLRAAPHRLISGPVEIFQSYLAYGVLALLIIRALAAVCRHALMRDGADLPKHLAQRNGRLT